LLQHHILYIFIEFATKVVKSYETTARLARNNKRLNRAICL
jgi:hypothetical protein